MKEIKDFNNEWSAREYFGEKPFEKEIKEKISDLLIKLQDSGGDKGSNNEPEAMKVFIQVEDQLLELFSQKKQKLVEEIKCFIDGIYIGDSKELATGIKNINIFLKELTQIINPK